MRIFTLLAALLLLTACGGGGSIDTDSTGQASICQRTDINSQVFCALQQDYLWYRDLPASINPDSYSSPNQLLQAVAAPQDGGAGDYWRMRRRFAGTGSQSLRKGLMSSPPRRV